MGELRVAMNIARMYASCFSYTMNSWSHFEMTSYGMHDKDGLFNYQSENPFIHSNYNKKNIIFVYIFIYRYILSPFISIRQH